jgi:hypothetical protein
MIVTVRAAKRFELLFDTEKNEVTDITVQNLPPNHTRQQIEEHLKKTLAGSIKDACAVWGS